MCETTVRTSITVDKNRKLLHAIKLYNFSSYHYHTSVLSLVSSTPINLEINLAEIRTFLPCTPHLGKLQSIQQNTE